MRLALPVFPSLRALHQARLTSPHLTSPRRSRGIGKASCLARMLQNSHLNVGPAAAAAPCIGKGHVEEGMFALNTEKGDGHGAGPLCHGDD